MNKMNTSAVKAFVREKADRIEIMQVVYWDVDDGLTRVASPSFSVVDLDAFRSSA